MEPSFDPYSQWLGFPQGQPPADYYALFGLARFESDEEAIAAAADAAKARVRSVRPGERLAEWRALLDNIAAGKSCLTDAVSRAAYDAMLRGEQPPHDKADPQALGQAGGGKPSRQPSAKQPGPSGKQPNGPAKQPNGGPAKQPNGPAKQPNGSAKQQRGKQQPAAAAGQAPAAGRETPPPPPAAGPPALPAAAASGDTVSLSANLASMPTPAIERPVPQPMFQRRRSPRLFLPWTHLFLLLIAAAAAGGGYYWYTNIYKPAQGGADATVAQATPAGQMPDAPAAEPAAEKTPAKAEAKAETPGIAAAKPEAAAPPAAKTEATPEVKPAAAANAAAEAKPAASTPDAIAAEAKPAASAPDAMAAEPKPATSPPDAMAAEAKPAETAPDAMAAESKPAESAAPAPYLFTNEAEMMLLEERAKAEANKPKPEPVVAKVEPKPEPHADEARYQEMLKALTEARLALSRRDAFAANRAVQVADGLTQTDGDRDKVRRMRVAIDGVAQFWVSLRTRIAALQLAEELDLGSDRAIVTDLSPSELIIREQGQVKRYPVMAIPARLIAPLVKEAVDRDPGSKTLYAVFLAVDPGGNPRKAWRLLAEAADAGARMANELPPVEDLAPRPGDALPETEIAKPLMNPARLKVSEQQIKNRHAAEYEAATTPAKKSALAEKLMGPGVVVQQDLEGRFGPLRQAYFLAVQAGNADLAMTAVDRMAQLYSVDVLTAKANAVEEIAKTAAGDESVRRNGEVAVQLAESALAQSRPAEGARLAKVALEAAQKCKSSSLTEAATALARRIEQLKK